MPTGSSFPENSGDAQGLRAGQLVHRHARERGRADGFADNSGRGTPRWMREAARLTESTAHNVRYVNSRTQATFDSRP